MSFKSTPPRITAQTRGSRRFQGVRPAFIRTLVIEGLKSEVVRADRVESVLQRLRSDIEEDRASGRRSNATELSLDELILQIKRKLSNAGVPNDGADEA